MPVDPREILGEIAPDSVPADAPPAVANYRHADLQGVSCAFCQKFTMTGLRESDGVAIPVGVCDQWEANVDGVKVCDRFASGAPAFDHNGEEVWDFADGERTFNEIHLAGTESVEDSGFVVKEVLRTGEWPVIPTASGVIGKPLRVVRDGVSSAREGVISMSELVANFEAGAIERPQIPLSDDRDDHKNITRVNTGFVRGLWIEDKDSGAVLKAKMEFTEPEVKAKVLRGTYADVSCGIPWKIRARGKEYGATLEHIAITNRPFIDGLGPFLAASDEQRADAEIVNYGDHIEVALSQGTVEIPPLSDEQIVLAATSALEAMAHNYARDYAVTAADGVLRLRHDRVGTTWTVPFQASEKDGEISLAFSNFQEWTVEEGETIEPSAQGGSLPAPELSDLEKAWRLRELRLAQPLNAQRAKESYMPLSREELAALELSDDARAAIQTVLDENARLSAQTREADADRRVDELKALGLSDRPGALKFYRQVFLSDDGGPAVVLSDSDGREKSRLSALEILDQFIEGVKGSDGKLNLSDQALASGNDDRPPATSETETEKPVEERLAEAKSALYGAKK